MTWHGSVLVKRTIFLVFAGAHIDIAAVCDADMASEDTEERIVSNSSIMLNDRCQTVSIHKFRRGDLEKFS